MEEETELRREEDKDREGAWENSRGRQSRDVGTLRGGGTGRGALAEPGLLCSQSPAPNTLYYFGSNFGICFTFKESAS